jgi:hypothetical protein
MQKVASGTMKIRSVCSQESPATKNKLRRRNPAQWFDDEWRCRHPSKIIKDGIIAVPHHPLNLHNTCLMTETHTTITKKFASYLLAWNRISNIIKKEFGSWHTMREAKAGMNCFFEVNTRLMGE